MCCVCVVYVLCKRCVCVVYVLCMCCACDVLCMCCICVAHVLCMYFLKSAQQNEKVYATIVAEHLSRKMQTNARTNIYTHMGWPQIVGSIKL